MAWSSAELSADELAFFAADKPLLVASVCPRDGVSTYINTTGLPSTGDSAATATPSARVYDGYCHLPAAPSTGNTDWYYIFNFGISISFDCVFIIGHDLGTDAVTAVLEISDDANWTTPGTPSTVTQIASFGAPVADDKRKVDWVLIDGAYTNARRYTAQHARLKLTKGVNFTPSINEIVFGHRCQLKHAPKEPFNPNAYSSNVEANVSESGLINKVTKSHGKFNLSASFSIYETARIADITTLWSNSRNGTAPLIWCPNPTTAPNDWYMMSVPDPSLDFSYEGWAERVLNIEAEEIGPDRYYLVRGIA